MSKWTNIVFTNAPESAHGDIRWAMVNLCQGMDPYCEGDTIDRATNWGGAPPPSPDLVWFLEYKSVGEPTDAICTGLADQFPDYTFAYLNAGEDEE